MCVSARILALRSRTSVLSVGQRVEAEAIAHSGHARRQLQRDLDVPVLLVDLVVAPVAAVALDLVLGDVAIERPFGFPAGDLDEFDGEFRGRHLTREGDGVRRTNVDDRTRVVERRLLVIERVRLLVVAHEEHFREVLAARVTRDAQNGVDVEETLGDGLFQIGLGHGMVGRLGRGECGGAGRPKWTSAMDRHDPRIGTRDGQPGARAKSAGLPFWAGFLGLGGPNRRRSARIRRPTVTNRHRRLA